MLRPRSLCVLLATVALCGTHLLPSALADDSKPLPGDPGVPASVREALLREDYSHALELLEELAGKDSDHADLWQFARAKTLSLGNRLDEARGVLQGFGEAYPESRWRHLARFLLAEVLREQGDDAGAERILEAEVARLRSPTRIGELADIYLDLAGRLSTPADPGDLGALPLDYNRAHLLYGKVIELEPPTDRFERAFFRRGVCLEELGRWGEASNAFREYLARFDPEAHLDTRLGVGAQVFRARFELGRCEARLGVGDGARRVFQDLEAAIAAALRGDPRWSRLPSDETSHAAWADLQAECLWEAAWTWPRESVIETELAATSLRRLLEGHPAHRRTPQAAYVIGEWLAAITQPDAAIEAWTRYRASESRITDPTVADEDARLRQRAAFRIGELRLAQGRLDDAIAVFTEYTTRYPTGSDWAAAQQRIIDAEYQDGDHRYRAGEFAAARESWERFLVRHPIDSRAPMIIGRIGQSHVDQSRRLDRESDSLDRAALEPMWREAIRVWRRLVAKYPQDTHAQRARFAIAEVLETDLLDPDTAIPAYRECFGTSYESSARTRLARMVERELTVSTPRTWRSGEAAKIRVESRNIEELEVRIYPIDLEAYFQKHRTHAGIDRLDLDLIAAAETVTISVDRYRQYLPLTRDVELPVEGAGAWAISVTAGELQATTLVLRSDIDVIVKSSRREVFVFAQSMKDDAPAEGVRVLVDLETAEGPSVREVRTGVDGVVRVRFDELASGSAVRVFAEKDGHVASSGLSLDGLSLSSGPQPRGVIITDRRGYRPGNTVRWRAVLREVVDGHYSFEPGAKYRVEAIGPNGEVWWRGERDLGDFGTLHGELELSSLAPLGSHQIVCSTPNGPSFRGHFQVDEYVPRRVDLTLETERMVFYRGETIELVARARFYYGEPLADAPIRIELPDGRQLDLRTDAEGTARVPFETRELPFEGEIDFSAQLPEEDVHADTLVYLAVTGYSFAIELPRDLYLSGTPVPVTVRATTPDGKPAARELSLRVERFETDPFGQLTPVTVETHPLATDAEGTASTALRLDRGGQYRLRAEGSDRFGNPVSAERELTISGEEDAVKLRVLTERTRVDVGETLSVDLHHRGEPGLALVTFEGEEILEYRLVRLQRGTNPLEVMVGSSMFPSFHVAVTRMAGRELLEAGASFEVSRRLQIEIVTPETPVRPGDPTTIGVRITDGLGNPVEAELSLAVIDAAVWDLYGEAVDLVEVFDAFRREPALRSASSCVFEYRGETRRIARAVLDELARAEDEAGFEVRRLEVMSSLEAQREVVLGGAGGQGSRPDRGGRQRASQSGMEPASRPMGGVDEEDLQLLKDERFAGGAFNGPTTFGANFRRNGDDRAPGDSPERRRPLDFDTAFWTPSVITDSDGRAEITFPIPPRSTRWHVSAHGVTRESQFGGGHGSLVSREDLILEIVSPPSFLEGDAPRIAIRAHSLGEESGRGRLTLVARAGASARTFTAEIDLEPGKPVEHLFEALAALPAPESLSLIATLEATFPSGTRTIETIREIPVAPWGLEVAARSAGELTDETAFELSIPGSGTLRDRELTVFVGAGLDPLLVEEALGGISSVGRRTGAIAMTHTSRANALLGILEVLARGDGSLDAARRRQLRQRSEGLTATLVAAQREDGGWAWTGMGTSHLETSCRVAWALESSHHAGRAVPPRVIERAVTFLEAKSRELPQQATEQKVMLVHALSVLGSDDFGAANRLHRGRESLSPAALAHLTLALAAMDRGSMAHETAELLERAGDSHGRWPLEKNRQFQRDPLGMDALALLALVEARPSSPRIRELVDGLLERHPWGRSCEQGLVVAAIARYQGETVPARARLEVLLETGDEAPQRFVLDDRAASHTMVIPLGDGAGTLPVRLRVVGRGRARYAAVLRGTTREVAARVETAFAIEHHLYQAVAPRHEGRPISTGFGVLQGSFQRWQNLVSELPRGHILDGELQLRDRRRGQRTDDHAQYLAVEIPIPAGMRLLAGSLSGPIEHHVVEDDRVVLHLRQDGSVTIGYSLVAFLPGEYRALPVVVRSVPEPDRISIGEAVSLKILPRDEQSSNPYRPTPNELFYFGKALYDGGSFDEAHSRLSALYDGFEDRLEEPVLRDAATMLLFLSIRREDSPAIVRFFEVLKEKNPDLDIPFDRVVRVGEAYREIGEHAQAMLVFRAVIEETFGKDLKIPGVLEEQSDLANSLATFDRLLSEYPPIPTVVESWLTVADKRMASAPGAASDTSLRRAGIDRAQLQADAIRGLERFLALHSENPTAPDAGLNLVSAHLGLEDYETAAKLAGTFAGLYEEPRYVDSFLYTRAVAEWYLGLDREALDRLARIADALYIEEDGTERRSENRELALYILGQIHHARREFAEAARYYERVEEEFSDAREALEGFRARSIEMDEVTTARPGGTVPLEIRARNIPEVELLVYEVDLMTLYLREKNLSNVTAVELAGITPTIRQKLVLPAPEEAKSLDPIENTVELALPEAGAYLVICRGGDRHSSALVLVSHLELRVAEDTVSGRMRVQAVDPRDGSFIRGVDVRVIGSANEGFVTGESDPRGLFIADGIRGTATVIARHGKEDYAFHRGELALGAPPENQAQTREPQGTIGGQLDANQYFKNVLDFNGAQQGMRSENFQREVKQTRKGVKVKQAQ